MFRRKFSSHRVTKIQLPVSKAIRPWLTSKTLRITSPQLCSRYTLLLLFRRLKRAGDSAHRPCLANCRKCTAPGGETTFILLSPTCFHNLLHPPIPQMSGPMWVFHLRRGLGTEGWLPPNYLLPLIMWNTLLLNKYNTSEIDLFSL